MTGGGGEALAAAAAAVESLVAAALVGRLRRRSLRVRRCVSGASRSVAGEGTMQLNYIFDDSMFA
jgi:hypothetical protein